MKLWLKSAPGSLLSSVRLTLAILALEGAPRLTNALADKYKDSLVAKLAIKVRSSAIPALLESSRPPPTSQVSELYEQALAATEKDSAATVFPAVRDKSFSSMSSSSPALGPRTELDRAHAGQAAPLCRGCQLFVFVSCSLWLASMHY